MKKVLIVANDFLPYSPSLGGVIRVLTLAEYLSKNGFEVFIIASKSADFGFYGYEEKLKYFKITYIDNKLQSYIFKGAAQKKEFLNENTNNSQKKNLKTLLKKFTVFFKYKLKKVVIEFSIPDTNVFVKNQFIKKAKKLIKEYKIGNVIVSSPPHSMQLVGYKLKKYFKNNINLIADYRDSWNTVSTFSKKNPLSKAISCSYEKKVLKNCDYFTFISNPMLSKVEKLYNIKIRDKSHLVMNGFISEIENNEIITKNDKIKIGYFGAISDSPNSTRNISNILETLKNNKEFDEFELHLYGDVSISNYNLALIPNVFIHKSLYHKEALSEMFRMDYLLIVHSDKKSCDEVITGKFFEYVAAKKIIVCIGPVDMEAKRLIEKYKVGINIDIDDPEEMKLKFLSLKSIDKNDFYKNLDVTIFKRDVQYKTFLKLLK